MSKLRRNLAIVASVDLAFSFIAHPHDPAHLCIALSTVLGLGAAALLSLVSEKLP